MDEVQAEQKGIFGAFLDAAKDVLVAKFGQQPDTKTNSPKAQMDWRKIALIGVGVLVLVLVLKKL